MIGLYDHIKEVCSEKNISVTYLEKTAGLANGAISKWNASNPSINSLMMVAQKLNLPIESFLPYLREKKTDDTKESED